MNPWISWTISLGTVAITLACVFVTWHGARRWHHLGWIEGRSAMVQAIARGLEEGVDLEVVLISEAMRDGVPVYHYADEDGHPYPPEDGYPEYGKELP